MIDRQLLRSYPDLLRSGAARKGIDAPIDDAVRLDAERREVLTSLESERAELNRVSKSIGALISKGQRNAGEEAKQETGKLKERITQLEERVKQIQGNLYDAELRIPNMPHESVPDGKTPEDNVEVSVFSEKQTFAFQPKPHWEIAEDLGILDFQRGAAISGSGFIVFRGMGARLQRALISFMLDTHTQKHGYTEIYPPYLVTRECLIGTGQLPKFEDDQYRMERDDLFLIPTAEVPLTNLHRDEILRCDELPIRYAAFSGCFRREAGAAGKDTRGLLRVHQFDKVELVKICTPETSFDEIESMTRDAESILKTLGLHYRVVLMCAGEMGFSNSKQYDLEIWAPGVQRYLEVSSASNFTDFQARRVNIRYRPEPNAKPQFVHTLNASGVACPRLMAAILEANQQEDGSVIVPSALRPFMGAEVITQA